MSEVEVNHIKKFAVTLAKILFGVVSTWLFGIILVAIFDYHSWIFIATTLFFFIVTSALLMHGEEDD